ncbi:hypothetical protein [Nocardia sp. NPDC046763]|uniref:hypothetical protein n=1 Tax=Nocardia sp. NPDC046763 TaxID=3155256 RepID=UPI0033C908E0
MARKRLRRPREAQTQRWASDLLTDRNLGVADEVARIAAELDTTAVAVALAWVASRPGISSTSTSPRTIEQLDENPTVDPPADRTRRAPRCSVRPLERTGQRNVHQRNLIPVLAIDATRPCENSAIHRCESQRLSQSRRSFGKRSVSDRVQGDLAGLNLAVNSEISATFRA